MRLLTVFLMTLVSIVISALPALAAQPCELPHQRISKECGGTENLEVIGSGIAKRAEQPALKDLLETYRQKSHEAAEIVETAKGKTE